MEGKKIYTFPYGAELPSLNLLRFINYSRVKVKDIEIRALE